MLCLPRDGRVSIQASGKRLRPFVGNHAIGLAVWLAAVSILVFLLTATPIYSQFQNPRFEDDVVLFAPRAVQRLLAEGERAIQEARYADAISALGGLFDDDNELIQADIRGQDFFLQPDNPGAAQFQRLGHYTKTIKGVAQQLLGNLPEKGRRLLEIEYGVKAKQLLKAATAEGDWRGIAEVARRYPFTDAGYDAQIVLANALLRDGEPLGAAAKFQHLLDFDAARQRYGPELARAAALSWLLGEMPDIASSCLSLSTNHFQGQSIEIGGQQVEFRSDQDWDAIIASASDMDDSAANMDSATEWLVSGGSTRRSAVVDVSMPISSRRWVAKTHGSISEKRALFELAQSQLANNEVLLPKAEIRAIGDLVLAKTTDARILALDLQTGLIRWAYYENGAPADLLNNSVNRIGATDGLTSNVSSELQNRVWGSSAFGRFSCDNERLYYVTEGSHTQVVTQQQIQAFGAMTRTNQLHAASLEDEGFVLWIVGSQNDDNTTQLTHTDLDGAFFLGPPLSHEGTLYCIVEIRGEVRLAALDPADGQVLWTQHLCNPSFRQADATRKDQAVSPTIADGLILCPTGAQGIAAVDLATRGLRWLVTYQLQGDTNANQGFGRALYVGGGSQPLDDKWNDNAMVADGGLIGFSPVEKDMVFVINAFSGEVVWKRPRSDARYIAGLRDGRIYLVCQNRVQCIDVENGSEVWATAFPRSGQISGKALWQSDNLTLPLEGNRLLRLDLETGDISDEMELELPVGNLFAHRGNLISATPTTISVFATRRQLEQSVERRLSQDRDDPIGLNQKAQLLQATGDFDASFKLLRRSYELNPGDIDTRSLLIDTLLIGLEKDFETYAPIANELKEVVQDDPSRSQYLQWMAMGGLKAKRPMDAFTNLMAFMRERLSQSRGLAANQDEDMDLSASHSINIDAWIAVALSRCYEMADQQQREEMARVIEGELTRLPTLVVSQRRLLLRYFVWHPVASQQIVATALALGRSEDEENSEQTEIERLLIPLLNSTDKDLQLVASQLLSRLTFADRNRFGSMGPILSTLYTSDGEPNTDDALLDPIVSVRDAPEWNQGQVILTQPQRRTLYPSGIRIEDLSQRFGRPDVDIRLSGSDIVLCNMNGQTVTRVRYGRGTSDFRSNLNRARVMGGLLIVETSSELVAIDLYRAVSSQRDAVLWRHSLLMTRSALSERFRKTQGEVKDTSFGWQIATRSNGTVTASIGPWTPGGLILHKDSQVMCLDPYTGKSVWVRDGYSQDVRFAFQAQALAVVDAELGTVEVLDCRDGTENLNRRAAFPGGWEHWFSHSDLVVDYRESVVQGGSGIAASKPDFRVWNPLASESFAEFNDLKQGARAAVLEDRYLVIADQSDQLHFMDLLKKERRTWNVPVDDELSSIRLVRFGNRLVVVSSRQKTPAEIKLLSKRNNLTPDQLEVHGSVYGIDLDELELSWERPAKLFGMYFNINQPRNSPMMVLYRFHVGATCAVAMLDLRDGKLAVTESDIPVTHNGGFSMELQPREQTLELTIGNRNVRFKLTDGPVPPKPVARYGYIPTKDTEVKLNIDDLIDN